jgi:hypothetical protein
LGGIWALASIATATIFPRRVLVGCAGVAQHDMFASWALAHACLVLCNTVDLAPGCFSSDFVGPGIGLSNAGSVDRDLVHCEFVVERIHERFDQVIE